MKAHDFYKLLNKRMSESVSYGGVEITANGGFQVVLDIEYCNDCTQFHIVTMPTNQAKELIDETTRSEV